MVSLTIVDDTANDNVLGHPDGLAAHLGGHENETHLDEGVAKFLIDKFKIQSVADVGCGPGGMAPVWKNLGVDWLGIDGDHTVEREVDIKIHDYAVSPYRLDTARDLAWSVEFLEHVDQQFILNFMETFQGCKYVVATHALPGQPGHHHVNCQPPEYWVAIFRAFGFEIDVETTNDLRQASTMSERYMRQQSLFFRNLNPPKVNSAEPKKSRKKSG